MNYLAHAYLSFNNDDLLAGNMISDYVKGKKQFDYPAGIQKGIQLHRAIDDFTDTHEATKEMKEYFKPAYRLYAGAFADVVYDYFLANDKGQFFSEGHLKDFTLNTYEKLDNNFKHFPQQFAAMFPYMRSQNWLYNYRLNEGMKKSFDGLQRRAKYITETDTAFGIFMDNQKQLRGYYDAFFPHVKSFAAYKMEELLNP
jgi:acyl carrier protein phosphodiesterase